MNVLEPELFLNESNTNPVVDVRSPGEFEKGHIKGAINVPLFDNNERAEIGTIYTKTGRLEAVERGMEIVGPKMADFIKQVKKINPSEKVLVYCWRGGMRSESMAWLFERAGITCSTLKGGYKAFRNFLLSKTGDTSNLIVIDGNTGSGKTDILTKLKEKGEQIIDLESLANHRGSVFGGIGLSSQPTTQQFENNLFYEILILDGSKRTWVEAESKSIGKIFLPKAFWEKLTSAETFEINVPLENRIKRLAREYGMHPGTEIENSIGMLTKRIGEVTKNELLNLYRCGDYESVARKLLEYYDKLYITSRERISANRKRIDLPGDDPELNSDLLIELANNFKL